MTLAWGLSNNKCGDVHKMKVVAMIPIKLNNERIQRKNIKRFSDRMPLILKIHRGCLNAEK